MLCLKMQETAADKHLRWRVVRLALQEWRSVQETPQPVAALKQRVILVTS
jgi:hypothetical protein